MTFLFRDSRAAGEANNLTAIEGDRNMRGIRGTQDPVVITASTVLTYESHANRELIINSPTAINLDMPAGEPAAGVAIAGVYFYGTNIGAGLATPRLNGGGAIPANAILPATVDQYSAFEIRKLSTGYVRTA